ncbi:MAG: tRNA methyl transferase PRC-barrel domain-containing protein, partial [Treponemataceae bacterium]
YANVIRPTHNIVPQWDMKGENGQHPFLITQAQDISKDQSYFLYRIPSSTLEKVRFPLGALSKKEVFAYAREKHLEAAERQESQDFVPPEYFEALFADKESVEGEFINLDGRILGKHRGIEHYTIGQRRGLGVSSNTPLYVHSIDAQKNTIVLAHDDDLFAPALLANDWVWPNNTMPTQPFEAMVKIRLAAQPVKATIKPYSNVANTTNNAEVLYHIKFDQPQRAIAPGQSVVAYINGTIVGGGVISQKLDE